jgi:hypothetical protein
MKKWGNGTIEAANRLGDNRVIRANRLYRPRFVTVYRLISKERKRTEEGLFLICSPG